MNNNELSISLVQTALSWEQAQTNRGHIDQILQKAESTDLIVLPEMFTTGFSMNPYDHAETMDGPSIQWVLEKAAFHCAAICGSMMIKDGAYFYNRLIFAKPDGSLSWYDKRHLFAKGGEDKPYTAGSERIVVQYKGWRICTLICYDLRFPVWSRNTKDYDIAIYVANWPVERADAWKILLRARAIENQCYVVGVNRTGVDGSGFSYQGDSRVIDFGGTPILDPNNADGVFQTTLKKKPMQTYRSKLPFLRDMDNFKIEF